MKADAQGAFCILFAWPKKAVKFDVRSVLNFCILVMLLKPSGPTLMHHPLSNPFNTDEIGSLRSVEIQPLPKNCENVKRSAPLPFYPSGLKVWPKGLLEKTLESFSSPWPDFIMSRGEERQKKV